MNVAQILKQKPSYINLTLTVYNTLMFQELLVDDCPFRKYIQGLYTYWNIKILAFWFFFLKPSETIFQIFFAGNNLFYIQVLYNQF